LPLRKKLQKQHFQAKPAPNLPLSVKRSGLTKGSDMTRSVRLFLAGIFTLILLAAAGWFLLLPNLNRSVADSLGRGDYQLVTTDGQPFTFATLKGAPSAVFFGYTHCPDVCPTTLGDVATWQEELAQEGKELRVFFMTVDPERDTVDVLKDYVSWVPGVTGVTGSRAEVDKAIQSFRIYAQKVGEGDDGYFMDHTATMLTFDAKGRLAEPISYQEDYDRAMGKIRRLLEGKTRG
jgi:protein SCO1